MGGYLSDNLDSVRLNMCQKSGRWEKSKAFFLEGMRKREWESGRLNSDSLFFTVVGYENQSNTTKKNSKRRLNECFTKGRKDETFEHT